MRNGEWRMNEELEISVLEELKQKYPKYFNPNILSFCILSQNEKVYAHILEKAWDTNGKESLQARIEDLCFEFNGSLQELKEAFVNLDIYSHFMIADFIFNWSGEIGDYAYYCDPSLVEEGFEFVYAFNKDYRKDNNVMEITMAEVWNLREDINYRIIEFYTTESSIPYYSEIHYKYLKRLFERNRAKVIEKESSFFFYVKNKDLIENMMYRLEEYL